MKLFNAFKNYWKIYTLINFIIITVLSLYPLPQLPTHIGGDKFHHLMAYFFLSIAISTLKPNNYKIMILFFIFYGGFIEMAQPYVNRHGELLDFFYNFMGIVISLVVGSYLNKFLIK